MLMEVALPTFVQSQSASGKGPLPGAGQPALPVDDAGGLVRLDPLS